MVIAMAAKRRNGFLSVNTFLLARSLVLGHIEQKNQVFFVNFGSFQILRISYGMEATRCRLMTFNNKPFASFTV